MPARYAAAPGGTVERVHNSDDYTPRGNPSELIPILAPRQLGSEIPEGVSVRPNQWTGPFQRVHARCI